MTGVAKAAFPPPAKLKIPRGQPKLEAGLIVRAAKLYEAAGDWDLMRPNRRQSEVLDADDKEYKFVVLRNGMSDVLAVYSVWTKSSKPKIQRVGRFSAYPAALRRELAEGALWELDHLSSSGRATGR